MKLSSPVWQSTNLIFQNFGLVLEFGQKVSNLVPIVSYDLLKNVLFLKTDKGVWKLVDEMTDSKQGISG